MNAPPELEWEPVDSTAPAEETPLEPFEVPSPEVDAPVTPPDEPELVTLVPDQDDLKKEASEGEVWRPASEYPQIPLVLEDHFDTSYVADSNPVTILLHFDPKAAGKMIVIQPEEGVSVTPPEVELPIGSNGECVVNLSLADGYNHSAITIILDGHRSFMRIDRTTLAQVIQKEEETGGAQ